MVAQVKITLHWGEFIHQLVFRWLWTESVCNRIDVCRSACWWNWDLPERTADNGKARIIKVVVLHKTKFCKRKSDLKVCFCILYLKSFCLISQDDQIDILKTYFKGFFHFSQIETQPYFAVQSLNGNRDSKPQCNRASHFLLRRNKWKCLQDRLLLIMITQFFSSLSMLLLSVIFHICHFFFFLFDWRILQTWKKRWTKLTRQRRSATVSQKSASAPYSPQLQLFNRGCRH